MLPEVVDLQYAQWWDLTFDPRVKPQV